MDSEAQPLILLPQTMCLAMTSRMRDLEKAGGEDNLANNAVERCLLYCDPRFCRSLLPCLLNTGEDGFFAFGDPISLALHRIYCIVVGHDVPTAG